MGGVQVQCVLGTKGVRLQSYLQLWLAACLDVLTLSILHTANPVLSQALGVTREPWALPSRGTASNLDSQDTVRYVLSAGGSTEESI